MVHSSNRWHGNLHVTLRSQPGASSTAVVGKNSTQRSTEPLVAMADSISVKLNDKLLRTCYLLVLPHMRSTKSRSNQSARSEHADLHHRRTW